MYGHPLHVIHEKDPLELNPGKPKKKLTALKVFISIFLVSSLIYVITNRGKYEELSTYFSKPSTSFVYTVEPSITTGLQRREDDNKDSQKTTSKTDPTPTDKKEDTKTTDKPSKTSSEDKTTKTTDKPSKTSNEDKTTDKPTSKATDKSSDDKTTDKSTDDKNSKATDEPKDDKDVNTDSKSTKSDSKPTKTTSKPDPTPTETESSAPVPVYDQPGIRFVFALFGFILLNMFAIVIHHIYMVASKAGNTYKTVDDDISPF
ncbi:uncharacterized protein SPAPADRAFT_59590 [Spathaspora passalidarum NRRL Y-27907]|uniref:Uncharacterized protein n=1 Tax=Spathaspora passalidarum (strain NRRL Y-27907 / 11-Y1) TaxID=619300 RepID=G3AHJ7_SPAPN|nr:uncharacterized protein SPAPADRAFT_59590 [Spathaspora passalidarum NRRL Y-27907]EGW34161.1 hypothetical protein SPAPADRAFT_59590 [Spathaspora passalidarum NRRL Y-27907]